jgi:hypothetical protein
MVRAPIDFTFCTDAARKHQLTRTEELLEELHAAMNTVWREALDP